jgi:hypothetical protein
MFALRERINASYKTDIFTIYAIPNVRYLVQYFISVIEEEKKYKTIIIIRMLFLQNLYKYKVAANNLLNDKDKIEKILLLLRDPTIDSFFHL